MKGQTIFKADPAPKLTMRGKPYKRQPDLVGDYRRLLIKQKVKFVESIAIAESERGIFEKGERLITFTFED
jgi:hypothetical protein